MRGIVGLFLKDRGLEPKLGSLLTGMLEVSPPAASPIVL
jgi:hypothetical protein